MSKQLAKDILEGRQKITGDLDTLVIVAELCRDVLSISLFPKRETTDADLCKVCGVNSPNDPLFVDANGFCSVCSGKMTLGDGTPVKDILEMLEERKAEIRELKERLRTINNLAVAPQWRSGRRWQIEELSRR